MLGHIYVCIRRIKVGLLENTLRVIIAALKNRACPFSQEFLGHILDATFCTLAFGVEDNHLANAAGDQGVLVNGKLRESSQKVALDIVCRHGAVVQRFEEESNGFQ